MCDEKSATRLDIHVAQLTQRSFIRRKVKGCQRTQPVAPSSERNFHLPHDGARFIFFLNHEFICHVVSTKN
jgi:hypothetical protein